MTRLSLALAMLIAIVAFAMAAGCTHTHSDEHWRVSFEDETQNRRLDALEAGR